MCAIACSEIAMVSWGAYSFVIVPAVDLPCQMMSKSYQRVLSSGRQGAEIIVSRMWKHSRRGGVVQVMPRGCRADAMPLTVNHRSLNNLSRNTIRCCAMRLDSISKNDLKFVLNRSRRSSCPRNRCCTSSGQRSPQYLCLRTEIAEISRDVNDARTGLHANFCSPCQVKRNPLIGQYAYS